MNKYKDRRALVEAALIAVLATIFAVGTLNLPILSLFIVLIPVPFMVLAYRQEIQYAALSLIVFSLLTGVLTDLVYSVFLMAIFGPITLAMGHYIKKHKESYIVIGTGTVASILSIFIIFQLTSYLGGVSIINEISTTLESILNTQADLLQEMNLEAISVDEMLSYLLMIIPGVLIIQSMFIAVGNYYLTSAILKRLDSTNIELPQFSTFRLPGDIVFGLFLIFTLSYLTRYIEGIYHASLITNVTLFFMVIFFLQGISVISYLIKRTKAPKVVRILLIGMFFVISPLLTAISFIGLIDSIVDIRRLETK